MLNVLKEKLRKKRYIRKWKRKNTDNESMPSNIFNIDMVSVGKRTYGNINVLMFNDENRLDIGNYCSIAPEVIFIVSADHYTNHLSSFPFKAKIIKNSREGVSKGDIIVDDDVWIGYRSTVLSGVHIGQGAIIASGSVVSKDVPPYSIVAGVPAKTLKYRFKPEVVQFMLKLDYSSLDDEMIKKHIDELYTPIDEMSLEDLEKLFSWFPKKKNEDIEI